MSILIAPATVPPKLTANDRRINVSKILGKNFWHGKTGTVQVSVEGQSPFLNVLSFHQAGNMKSQFPYHLARVETSNWSRDIIAHGCPNYHCSKLPIALHDRCCHSPTALAQSPPAPSRMEDMWHIAKHLSSKTHILLIDKTPRTTWDNHHLWCYPRILSHQQYDFGSIFCNLPTSCFPNPPMKYHVNMQDQRF